MKKILIIEDSLTIIKALEVMLIDKGYETITAENAEIGIEKALFDNPDLIILDTVLPGMNGFEACKIIKEKKEEKAPKIIIMTGDIGAINSTQARQAGADEYVAKTSDFSLLFEAIDKLIN